jgi:SAM-dependent methyltransferase
MSKALFDTAAAQYDDTFTNSIIGKLQRERVYYWLDKAHFFTKNKSVFELNCGTGFDADFFNSKGLEVRATDVSPKMIAVAKQNRSEKIKFETLDFKDLNGEEITENAVFSNFGGLNCLSHSQLTDFISTLSAKQTLGNMVALVIMPKFSVVESLYLFLKLKWGQMFRRNTNLSVNVNVDGINIPTYFHAPNAVKKLLKDHYKILFTKPVALLLPPSYLEPLAKKHPRIAKIIYKLEGFFGSFSILAGLSDHFIIIAEKK